MYSFIVDENRKRKGVNKNVVAAISDCEYKNVFLRHSMIRIQSKNHRIATYGINKISLSYFDGKIKS